MEIKQNIISSNVIGEVLVRGFNGKACMLDKNNIVWKIVDGVWMGKRSVWTFDFRSCWLEYTSIENIKSWPCGKDSDYSEIIRKT